MVECVGCDGVPVKIDDVVARLQRCDQFRVTLADALRESLDALGDARHRELLIEIARRHDLL